MEKYHILYTIDDKYFRHFMVSLVSLLENNLDNNFVVHIISDELSSDNKKKLESLKNMYSNFSYELYNSSLILEYIKEFEIVPYKGSVVPLYRLFFSMFIKGIDKILYLDADTIVVGKLNLDDIEMTKPIHACIDHMQKSYITSLNSEIERYYNSGVLLINNKSFMNKGMFEALLESLKKNNNRLKFFDQDILNMTFNNELGILPFKYNVLSLDYYFKNIYEAFWSVFEYQEFYDESEVKDALKNPVILHGTDIYGVHAWDKNCIHPFNEIYRRYYNMIYSDKIPTSIDVEEILKSKYRKARILTKYYFNK